MTKRASVVEVLGPLLQAWPAEEQPALVALAERVAAGRYRLWAETVDAPELRTLLLSCAAREEEIAKRVEALHPGSAETQARFREKHPDLEERYASVFEGLALGEQWAVQAEAERAGAGLWRSFAEAGGPETEETFRSCAPLEEQNAEALERARETLAQGTGAA